MTAAHPFRYVFKLRNGETIVAAPKEVRRTLNKRNDNTAPELQWEILVSGVWREFWDSSDVESWSMEDRSRGSILVEYALVASLMGAGAIVALQQLGIGVADVLNQIAGEL